MIEKEEDVSICGPSKRPSRTNYCPCRERNEKTGGSGTSNAYLHRRSAHATVASREARCKRAGKPHDTRSTKVASRRKMGSFNRQVSGGHTSKVRCRSRCGANWFLLSLIQRSLGSSGPGYQTGLWPLFLALLSSLPVRPSAHKKMRRLPRKLFGSKRQASL